jgi:proteasome lid subunit RPN8/RPN11
MFKQVYGHARAKTPAEVCGIKVEGENKWITLIQNASKSADELERT